MARKYETTVIDGIEYELHSVKVDNKKIGLVPIICFSNSDAFREFIHDSTAGDLELVAADFRYGNAVRLQGMARKIVTGEGFSDAAMNKTYAAMTPDECARFHQDHAGLVKFCKEKWATMQAESSDGEYDADYVWDELVQ